MGQPMIIDTFTTWCHTIVNVMICVYLVRLPWFSLEIYDLFHRFMGGPGCVWIRIDWFSCWCERLNSYVVIWVWYCMICLILIDFGIKLNEFHSFYVFGWNIVMFVAVLYNLLPYIMVLLCVWLVQDQMWPSTHVFSCPVAQMFVDMVYMSTIHWIFMY